MQRWIPKAAGALAVVLAATAGVSMYRAHELRANAKAPAHRLCARGEEARYTFRLDASGRVHPIAFGGSAAGNATPSPYRTELEGELVLTCTGDADANGATPATVELHGIRVAAELPPALAGAAPSKEGLERSLATVTLGARGRFDDLRAPATMSASEKNALRTLLSFATVVLPEAPAKVWSTVEAAPMAMLATSYAVTSATDTSLEVTKTERRDGDKSATAKGAIDGHCTIPTDAMTGAPLAWSCERSEETRLGAIVAHAAKTTFAAKRAAVRTLDEHDLAALVERATGHDALARIELSPAAERAAASRAEDEKLALGQTVPAVIARLRDGSDKGEQSRILDALVRVRPEARAQLAKELVTLGSTDKAFGQVARVLVEEGGAAGQRAAIDAATQAGDDHKKMHVLTAHLGLAAEPSADNQKYLRSLRASGGEGARTADLALGNVAHTLLETDPASAQSIVDELKKALASATSPGDQIHALRALGNVGGEELVDVVAPYLDATNEDVRQVAVAALRRVETERAVELLVNKATFDASPVVRAAAVSALPSELPEGALTDALARLLARERSAVALREIVLKLRAVVPSDPRARQVLAAYDRTCAQTEVCSLVKQVLTAT